jgi:hypothetical protein
MLPKKHLPIRIEPALIARLDAVSKAIKNPVNDVISLALDALEREQNVAQTVTERLEYLENNLASLVELMTVFNEKIDQAGVSEKEHIKQLYRLLEIKMDEHDEAEIGRFKELAPRTS